MELQDKYIKTPHTAIVKGERIEIINDKLLFSKYKKMGLNIFKNKKVDSTDKK